MAKIGPVNFNAGSEGSSLEGMWFVAPVTISANNISLLRNGSSITNRIYNILIAITDGVSNAIIHQNYFHQAFAEGEWKAVIALYDGVQNCSISNNARNGRI